MGSNHSHKQGQFHIKFHADVIRRAKQIILTIKDHFSSFQDAMLLNSEKAEDLKNGIITLVSPLRKPAPICITVDNSPGFMSLISNSDKDLLMLMVKLCKTDEINKNANAIIDRGCQELEQELKRIEPEGRQISNATLKLAIMKLNSKLRRKGNISSYEIHTARDQTTGANLQLNDELLRTNQLLARKLNGKKTSKPDVLVGDTVMLKNRMDKHKAKDVFLVTGKNGNQIDMQKIAHSLSNEPTKLMSKVYKTGDKYVTTMHRSRLQEVDASDCNCDDQPVFKPKYIQKENVWSPINKLFYTNDDSDDEDNNPINVKKEMSIQRESESSNDELSWDDSPQQYELAIPISEEDPELADILRPKPLFMEPRTDSPSSSSHDEVFMEQSPIPPKNPRLKRRNAMRKKKTMTEPRITRRQLSLRSQHRSRSENASPTREVEELHRCQNLNNVLQPKRPIVPEAVNLLQSQNLSEVIPSDAPRRRLRDRPKVDYLKLHLGEDFTAEKKGTR